MRKLVGFPLVYIRGVGDCSRRVRHHLDPQVHLEPSEPHDLLALLQALRVNSGILRFCSIGIDADPVAKLAASEQRVHRSVIDLARDIPESHLNRAYPASLARVSAELLDLAENPVKL